jgi:hypothetical protein
MIIVEFPGMNWTPESQKLSKKFTHLGSLVKEFCDEI